MSNVLAMVSMNEVAAVENPEALDWMLGPGDVGVATLHHNLYLSGKDDPPYEIPEPVRPAILTLLKRGVSTCAYYHLVRCRDAGWQPDDVVNDVTAKRDLYGIRGVYFDGIWPQPRKSDADQTPAGLVMWRLCRKLRELGFVVFVHDSYWMNREPNAHGAWVRYADYVLDGELNLGWQLAEDWYQWQMESLPQVACVGDNLFPVERPALCLKFYADPSRTKAETAADELEAWKTQRKYGCSFRLSCGRNIECYCKTMGIYPPDKALGL